MPLNKKILDILLKEIERLEKNDDSKNIVQRNIIVSTPMDTNDEDSLKKTYLLPTEKQLFFYISNHYKLTMLSIDDPGIALEIWLKAILPLLLERHGLNNQEWERICNIGDSDETIKSQVQKEWVIFFKQIIQKGRIDEKIVQYLQEGKRKVERLRNNK
ncbi:MAG: hypothetical protein ACTSW1_17430 [Candidatus Hodarchaeales archaeon]